MSDADSRDNMNGGGGGVVGGGGAGGSAEQDNICRDFLRNVCRRGKRCKYQHPEPNDTKDFGRRADYIFCHDYQNKECRRPNCKFVHCTRSEEEYYRTCGQLPPRSNGGRGNPGMGAGGANEMDTDIPICKDFQKGECRRGGRCKFRHVGMDFNMEMGRDQFGGMGGGGGYVNFEEFEYYEPERKRRMFGGGASGGPDFGGAGMASRQAMTAAPLSTDYYILEEENVFLRRKVEELKKQLGDLTATNEFLLDQNAQLRLGKQTSVSSVPQSLNPNTMAQAAAPVQSTIAQISQQLPLTTELTGATAQALQAPRMAQELAAATTQAIVPVSLAQAATLAPVSIAPVTITQAIPAASLAQNPLVSYPIMTQNLRPALAPSSLTH